MVKRLSLASPEDQPLYVTKETPLNPLLASRLPRILSVCASSKSVCSRWKVHAPRDPNHPDVYYHPSRFQGSQDVCDNAVSQNVQHNPLIAEVCNFQDGDKCIVAVDGAWVLATILKTITDELGHDMAIVDIDNDEENQRWIEYTKPEKLPSCPPGGHRLLNVTVHLDDLPEGWCGTFVIDTDRICDPSERDVQGFTPEGSWTFRHPSFDAGMCASPDQFWEELNRRPELASNCNSSVFFMAVEKALKVARNMHPFITQKGYAADLCDEKNIDENYGGVCCFRCGEGGDSLMICEGCYRSGKVPKVVHPTCLTNPRMKILPADEDWFCNACLFDNYNKERLRKSQVIEDDHVRYVRRFFHPDGPEHNASGKHTTSFTMPQVDMPPKEYGIGLIMGPSGTGKTLMLEKLFGYKPDTKPWKRGLAVISQVDHRDPEASMNRLMEMGCSSMRDMCTSYENLSLGQQDCARMARTLGHGAVFDEFGSTLGPLDIIKLCKGLRRVVRKYGLGNVTVATCNPIVANFLKPDWIIFTGVGDKAPLKQYSKAYWGEDRKHRVQDALEAVSSRLRKSENGRKNWSSEEVAELKAKYAEYEAGRACGPPSANGELGDNDDSVADQDESLDADGQGKKANNNNDDLLNLERLLALPFQAKPQATSLRIRMESCNKDVWGYFKDDHYLDNADLACSAHVYLARLPDYDDIPVAIVAALAHPGRNNGITTRKHKGHWREHRVVVKPRYQGMGIGPAISDAIAASYFAMGCKYTSSFRHELLARHRRLSGLWQGNNNQRLRQKVTSAWHNLRAQQALQSDRTDWEPRPTEWRTRHESFKFVGERSAPRIKCPDPPSPSEKINTQDDEDLAVYISSDTSEPENTGDSCVPFSSDTEDQEAHAESVVERREGSAQCSWNRGTACGGNEGRRGVSPVRLPAPWSQTPRAPCPTIQSPPECPVLASLPPGKTKWIVTSRELNARSGTSQKPLIKHTWHDVRPQIGGAKGRRGLKAGDIKAQSHEAAGTMALTNQRQKDRQAGGSVGLPVQGPYKVGDLVEIQYAASRETRMIQNPWLPGVVTKVQVAQNIFGFVVHVQYDDSKKAKTIVEDMDFIRHSPDVDWKSLGPLNIGDVVQVKFAASRAQKVWLQAHVIDKKPSSYPHDRYEYMYSVWYDDDGDVEHRVRRQNINLLHAVEQMPPRNSEIEMVCEQANRDLRHNISGALVTNEEILFPFLATSTKEACQRTIEKCTGMALSCAAGSLEIRSDETGQAQAAEIWASQQRQVPGAETMEDLTHQSGETVLPSVRAKVLLSAPASASQKAAPAKLPATKEEHAHAQAVDSFVLAGGAHGITPHSKENVVLGGRADKVRAAEEAEESIQTGHSNGVGDSRKRLRECGDNPSEIMAGGSEHFKFGCQEQQSEILHEFQKGDKVLARFKSRSWDDAEIEELLPPDPKRHGQSGEIKKGRYRIRWEDGTTTDTIKISKHLKRKM